MSEENKNSFKPDVDTGGTSAGVIDAPTIEYDMEEIKPGLIEQKKRDIIYKTIITFIIFLLVILNPLIENLYTLSDKIIDTDIKIEDLEPVVRKIEQNTNGINYDQLKVNKFLLENLFFVGDKKYEIIQKFHNFFLDPKVRASLGDFELRQISIQGETDPKKVINVMNIRIEGKFASFNKDLQMMVSFLNKMIPIVVIDDVTFNKGNNIVFVGKIYTMNKDLFKYDYGKKYKEINEILRLKEEYAENQKILDKLLADKDLGLKKLGIEKLYNCKQYAKVIEKQNLIKDEDIKICYQVENLLNGIKKELDVKFNKLINK